MELSYQDIWAISLGFQALKMLRLPLPIRVSMNLAKVEVALQPHLEVVNKTRQAILDQVSQKDEKERNIPIEGNSPELDDFNKEWEKVRDNPESKVTVNIEKVKLPEKIASTCDKCHHNMDKPLMMDEGILVLLEKVVEVA